MIYKTVNTSMKILFKSHFSFNRCNKVLKGEVPHLKEKFLITRKRNLRYKDNNVLEDVSNIMKIESIFQKQENLRKEKKISMTMLIMKLSNGK